MQNTLLTSSDDVDNRIDQIATQILKSHTESPLFVALLRGAAPFASKLMFAITRQSPDFHPELDYMMVSTYGNSREASQPRIVTDLAPDTLIKGRPVIVLDDVLDKGITAHFVTQYLLSRGASSVQLAVLAVKKTKQVYEIQADYHAFEFDDVWLTGMGMDDSATTKEANRWTDDIQQAN